MSAEQQTEGSRIWSAVRLLLVVLVAVVVWRGVTTVAARRAAEERHRVYADACQPTELPAWLTERDVAGIRRDSGLAGKSFSLFTPGLAADFANAYARSPWVERVVASRLRAPNRVEVTLAIRKPVAGFLTDRNTIVLVDRHGIRLPGERRREPRGLGHPLFRLTGVKAPPPRAGAVWSPAVAEGARVAFELTGLDPAVDRSAAIFDVDVANVEGREDPARPEILLRAASGAVVEWGRSSLSKLGQLDPPASEKLSTLARAGEGHPGLRGGARVKLQFDGLIVEEAPVVRGPAPPAAVE